MFSDPNRMLIAQASQGAPPAIHAQGMRFRFKKRCDGRSLCIYQRSLAWQQEKIEESQ
jgi:hypothetical protein